MRVDYVLVHNFGSYDTFSLQPEGLTLLYGKTGSGKSTVADMIPWTLFGVTAKNGAADDILPWGNRDLSTGATVRVTLKDGSKVEIERTRGKVKDLSIRYLPCQDPVRGKDIKDTQKLINEILGVDASLYLAGAYFHEFSSTGNFFSASAKDRRTLFDQLTNLDLPNKVAERTTSARKELKKTIQEATTVIDRAKGRAEQVQHSIKDCQTRSNRWGAEQVDKASRARTERETFLADKQRKLDKLILDISALQSGAVPDRDFVHSLNHLKDELECQSTEKCPTCGTSRASESISALKDSIHELKQQRLYNQTLLRQIEFKTAELEAVEASTPPEPTSQLNPYEAQLKDLVTQLKSAEETVDKTDLELSNLNYRHTSLQHLYDLCFDLRGALLGRVIRDIQDSTNLYLEKFFDAEIRVDFAVTNSDDLDVTIHKSGYECVFSQLSKGQRQLLKLCFAVSVMYASANKAGIHFDNLFFDEALDGLDSELKVKAFRLLEELSTKHSSVYVIDHSTELQELFTNKMHVTLEGDHSQVSFNDE